MNFIFLGEKPEFVPLIAAWYFEEWGHQSGDSLEKTKERVSGMLNQDKLPLHILAMEGNEVLGVAQLKYREMTIYPEKKHWLGGVYVAPSARGRGVGTKLVTKALELAKAFGVSTLYLQTEQLDGGIYSALGWNPIEETDYNGVHVLVMKRAVS
jgi:GNAT superfamily N-acetyltransferase